MIDAGLDVADRIFGLAGFFAAGLATEADFFPVIRVGFFLAVAAGFFAAAFLAGFFGAEGGAVFEAASVGFESDVLAVSTADSADFVGVIPDAAAA